MADINTLFGNFIGQFDFKASDDLWARQSEAFKRFWKSKILDGGQRVVESDLDPIIRMLDAKAKGFDQNVDQAVAMTFVRQGVWYRAFNDLNSKTTIRDLMVQVFCEQNEDRLIVLIDSLHRANEPFKNGLTGRNANVLNALLFINNPSRFISSVSLNHRRQCYEAFELGDFDALDTYGKQIVRSNAKIQEFFSNNLDGKWSPRTISKFLYYKPTQSLWLSRGDSEATEALPSDEKQFDAQSTEFVLERHLEDFLVANWESTTLGQAYDLIEQDDDIVSQQYPTAIGKIDLLVRSKANQEYTIIELKKGQTNDDTVGQLARYMGWVKANLANNHNVNGIIVASAPDERLKYALSVVPNTKFFVYRLNFSLDEA